MWKTQLKVGSKSFTMPKVKLNVDPNEDKCCEEAKEKYIKKFLDYVDERWKEFYDNPKEAYDAVSRGKGIANSPCEKFREHIGGFDEDILREWEECDNVESTTQS